MKKCRQCGNIDKDESKFCSKCGSKFSEQYFYCTNCGKKIDFKNKFCKFCGKKVTSLPDFKERPRHEQKISQPVLIKDFSIQTKDTENQSFQYQNQAKNKRKWRIPVFTFTGIIVLIILAFSALMAASLFKPVNISFLKLSIDSGKFISADAPKNFTGSQGAYILSEDQKKLLKLLGYPDEFVTFFDDANEGARSDSWTYSLLQKSFFFYNGSYKGSSNHISDENNRSFNILKPENFSYKMHPLEVNYIMGKNGDEIIDKNNGKRYLLFDDAKTVFIFNDNNYLTGILKSAKPFYETNN